MSERYAGLTEEELQKMIQHAGVDQPVMSVRVVGDRVELCLLGGAVVPVPPFTPAPKPPTSDNTATMAQTSIGASASDAEAKQYPRKLEILEQLTVRQLKSLAAEAGLQRYRRANKAALIVMLSEHYTLEELENEVALLHF